MVSMSLTPIRLITSEVLGKDKFEKTTTESETVFYAINGQGMNRFEFEERVLAAYEDEHASHKERRGNGAPWHHLLGLQMKRLPNGECRS